MFTACLVLRHSASCDIDLVSCGVTRRSGAPQLVVALGVVPWSRGTWCSRNVPCNIAMLWCHLVSLDNHLGTCRSQHPVLVLSSSLWHSGALPWSMAIHDVPITSLLYYSVSASWQSLGHIVAINIPGGASWLAVALNILLWSMATLDVSTTSLVVLWCHSVSLDNH
jgi:hypothetical protein